MRLTCAMVLALLPGAVSAEDHSQVPNDAATAIDRGLVFLAKDAVAWKQEHGCASCHHAALVVWSMREAKRRGHAVDDVVLTDLTHWLAQSGDGRVGLPRPASAPKAFNSKALYFDGRRPSGAR